MRLPKKILPAPLRFSKNSSNAHGAWSPFLMTPWMRLRSAALPSQTLTALKMLSFAIDANSGGARAGVLSIPSRGLALATPALLVYTRKGLPLNLMPDLLAELKDEGALALQLNTMHL